MFLSVFIQQKYFFFAVNLAPADTVLLVHALPVKSRKRLAHDVTDSWVSLVSVVHDVTNTDCQTQNGSSHSCASATLKCPFFFFK